MCVGCDALPTTGVHALVAANAGAIALLASSVASVDCCGSRIDLGCIGMGCCSLSAIAPSSSGSENGSSLAGHDAVEVVEGVWS